MDKGKVCINAKQKVNGEWVDIDIDEIDWENINEIHVKGKYHFVRNHWIPVTERLPDDDTLMLVNYIDHRPDAMDIWIGWHEMENVWYIDGEEHSRERGNEVVAWMPLPEPWEGEQDA